MSSYDVNVPKSLTEIQEWFAKAITTPLDVKGNLKRGLGTEKKAAQYLSATPTLKPSQRIEIYNQQYYWRLFNILHETFPTVARILGPRNFNNTLAMPYLNTYIPDHWCINFCGNRFPKYLEKNYHKKDRELLLHAAHLDLAYTLSYFAEQPAGVNQNELDPEAVFNTPLQLRPSTFLFSFPFDLFEFRKLICKETLNYWTDKKLPVHVCGDVYVMISRIQERIIHARKISKGEYLFFSSFKHLQSIEQACEWIETQPEELQNDAEVNMGNWVQTLIAENLCFRPE